jgi:serine/threonine protein kinase
VVCKGHQRFTGEPVAIKLEYCENTLKHEAKMLNYLFSKGCRSIPSVYWFGIYKEAQFGLIMPLYDCNLLECFGTGNLDVKNMAIQAVRIFQTIHELFVVHRDIKPQNFMFRNNKLFLIDFGFSLFYIDENQEHYENNSSNHIIGTPDYVSINVHGGETYSRRDDLLSFGYVLHNLLMGSLPWKQNNRINVNLEKIGKSTVPPSHILHPSNEYKRKWKEWDNVKRNYENTEHIFMKKYMKYCYSLEFSEKPNYDYLFACFYQ